jgi:hypothetical protein
VGALKTGESERPITWAWQTLSIIVKKEKKTRNVNISAFIQISGNISRIKANDTLVLHAFFVEATYRQRQLNITRFLKETKKKLPHTCS